MDNRIFIADSNQMRSVDGKQEIYLEWPYTYLNSGFALPWKWGVTMVSVETPSENSTCPKFVDNSSLWVIKSPRVIHSVL